MNWLDDQETGRPPAQANSIAPEAILRHTAQHTVDRNQFILTGKPLMSKIQSSETDYRSSHLQRGKTYDGHLADAPFGAHMNDLERLHLTSIVPRLFPAGIPKYLDFACGTARITQTVAPFAKEAVGVDISPTMLEQARRKCPDVQFIEADLTQVKPEIGLFDLATSFRFFGNAEPALRSKVLQVLAEMVRPSGYLIINNHRNPHSLAALLHRATGGPSETDLTYSGLRRILGANGFQIIESHPIGAWLYRSRMFNQIGKLDDKLLKRERLFGHRMLSPIAPDTILVARRLA